MEIKMQSEFNILAEQEFDQINNGINKAKDGLVKVSFDETDSIIISVEKVESRFGKKFIDIYFHIRSELDIHILKGLGNLKNVKNCHCSIKFGETFPFCYRIRVKNEGSQEDVSSFIIYELFKNGIVRSPNDAFRNCTDVIKALTEEGTSGLSHVIGLIGELILIERLLAEHPSLDLNKAWYGYERSNRDFVVNSIGIEVKTTTSPESKHSITSLKQVTPCNSDEEVSGIEKGLFLLSISLIPLTSKNSINKEVNYSLYSLSKLYISITRMILDDSAKNAFFLNFSSYLNKNYKNESDLIADLEADRLLNMKFKLRFKRFYDMYDFDNIKIIREGNAINDFIHVDASSVNLVMFLPNMFSTENPLSFDDGIAYLLD